MKREKVLTCVIGMSAALVCLTIGYLFGAQGFNINQRKRATKSPVTITTEVKEKGSNTRKIALVNTDEAIVKGKKTVNYADKLTQGMPKNFESVSLEMAKEGVANGDYAAYVIIPSTFSKSVISINSTPKPVKLEYKISPKITKTAQIDATYDVLNFERKLSAEMSYMYISSILGEFHNTQDGASVVMDNDKKDKDALLAITPSDLTTLVETPELTENDMEPMPEIDTSDCDEAIENINTNYTYYISVGQDELDKIKNSGNELVKKWANKSNDSQTEGPIYDGISQYQKKFNIPTVSKKTNNYDSQLELVLQQVDKYNSYLEDYEKKYLDNLLTAKTNVSESSNQLDKIVTDYNISLNEKRAHASDVIYDALSKEGAKVTLSYKDNCLYINDEKTNIYDSSLTSDASNYIKDLEDIIVNSRDQQLIDKFNNYKKDKNNENKISASNLLENNSNFVLIDKSNLTQNLNAKVNSALVKQSASKDSINKAMTDALPSDFDDHIVINGANTTIRNSLKTADESLSKQSDSGTTLIKRFDRDELKNNIQNNLINTIVGDGNTIQNTMSDDFKNFVSELNGYSLNNYMEPNKISESLDDAKTQNLNLQKAYEENYLSNRQYISDYALDAQENIARMQESMVKANDDSNANIETQLSGAIDVKDATTKENSDILMDITKKLPYTRLGDLEATSTYKFVTNPIGLKNSKKKVSRGSGIISNITKDTKDDKDSYINVKFILYIIFIALMVGFTAYIIKLFSNRENECKFYI